MTRTQSRHLGQWAALIGAVASLVLQPPLAPLLLGVLGLLRGRVWGVLLMLAGGAALLLGESGPGAVVAGGAGLLVFSLAAPLLWRSDRSATVAASLLALVLGATLARETSTALEPRSVDRSALEPLISGETESPYAPSPNPPLARVCDPGPSRESLYRKRVIYDFDDELLQPLPFGPLVSERPRTTPRTARDLVEPLERHRPWLRDCYRWARAERPGLEAQLTIEARCDVFGSCALLSVEPDRPAATALARCARQVLRGLELDLPSLRATSARFVLRFTPSGQVPDRAEHPGSQRSDPPWREPGMCFLVPRDAGAQRLVLPAPILTIDDFDPEQVRRDELAEYERKLEAWRRGGRVGLRPQRRLDLTVHVDHFWRPWWPDKEQLRRNVRYNAGRYRACYREALARRPGLSGRVVLSAVIDQGGNLAAQVQSSTAKDRTLEQCLRRALEEVWFAPLRDRTVVLSLPFLLDPLPAVTPRVPLIARPDEVEASAAIVLAHGDGRTALRGYSALLRQLPDDPRDCGWRAGALESLLAIAPWGAEDPRVIEAARALLRTIGSRGDRACLKRSLPVLSGLATRPHRDSVGGMRWMLPLAERMYGLLLDELAAFPYETYELRYYRAEALYRLERFSEAAPLYREVSLLGGRFSADAAYAQLIALKNVLQPDGWDPDGPGPLAACRAQPEVARQLAAAIDLYLTHIPSAEALRDLYLAQRGQLVRCSAR